MGLRFWTCPIRRHSDGSWRTGAVPTVEWRDGVAHCLAPGCERTSSNPIPDDGRTWWLVGSETWGSIHIYEARNGRAAIAAFRRDVVAAERGSYPVRTTRETLARAGLHIAAGPIRTRRAFEYHLA